MSDFELKSINNVLLRVNSALSTCCCDNGTYFWEGVPCDMVLPLRGSLCAEWDKCQYSNRIYLDSSSMCDGDEYPICECQRLNILTGTIFAPQLLNEVTVSYVGANNLTITWASDSVTVDENSTINVYNFSDTTTDTLSELFTRINTDYPSISLSTSNISQNLAPYVISGETLNFVGAGTQYFDTLKAGLIFELDGGVTTLAEYNSDLSVFANNIATALNTLGGPTFSTLFNSNASTNTTGYFAIIFGGSACGAAQSPLTVNQMRLLYQTYNGMPSDVNIEYPNYSCGWGTLGVNYTALDRYYIATGFHTTGCPLEQRQNNGPIIHATGGQLAIQCCPQRGVTIGPPQNLNVAYSGYYESSDFSNLEGTIIHDGFCYNVDPFYFMIGKEGRFTQNWKNTAFTTYRIPDCKFNEGACDASLLPTNCSPELFLPQLHKDIPWGPFGSYHTNVENEDHPATAAVGYLLGRIGFDYKPYAYMRTLGSWTQTTGIVVNLKYYRNVPFYIGTNAAEDKIGGTVKTTTLSAGFTLENNTSNASYVNIVFDTSGRTVGDFINGMNALRGSGLTDDDSCSLFQFCYASDDIANIPASKILNNSAEIWDLRKIRLDEALNDYYPDDPTGYVQAFNPETDFVTSFSATDFWQRLTSGSDIFPAEVEYRDRFANVRYGLPGIPNFNYDCYAIENERVARPSLYVNPPSTAGAILPPYCRHKKTLPNHSGGFWLTTDPGSSTSHLQGDVQPRFMPWWTPMQGTIENLISVYPNPAALDPLIQLNVWVSGRTIWVSGLRYSGVVPTGTITGIATDRGGDRYLVSDALVDLSGITYFQIGDTPNPYSPLLVASGSYPFEVLLDDSTWMDPVNEFPVSSGFPGAVRTSHNWAYVEPLLDSDPVDIMQNGYANLTSFVRLRHDWYNEDDQSYQNPPRKLPRCVPPTSTIIGSGIKVDCDGDKVIEGSWIVSYGCTSRVCKTTWFYASQRCPCDTEFVCDDEGGSTVAHRFNQEGNDLKNDTRWSNTGGYTTYVNQPTLYVCALNFHRDCDIPALIKVPYQIVVDAPDTDCISNYTIRYAYTNGVVSTPHGLASNSYSFDFYNGEGEDEGWCQWIDPGNPGTFIAKEDIPRTWPPKAYIAERSVTVLCSTNLYPFSLDTWCNDIPVYTLEGWDRIENIYPWAPPEVSDSSNRGCGTPTSGDESLLVALFRPIVNSITHGDLCPGGNCNRVDINCSTKCCGCFFTCNIADGCLDQGPKYYPEEYDVSYTETHTYTDFVELCDAVPGGTGAGACNIGCCTDPFGGSFVRVPSWGVRYTLTISASFALHFNGTCSICLGEGSETVTQTVDDSGCTGEYLPPCVDNACNNGCTTCCNYTIVNPIGCNNWTGYRDRASVCDESGNGVFIIPSFCDCGGIGSFQCPFPQLIQKTIDVTCTNTFNACGNGTATKVVANINDANGGAVGPYPGCQNGDTLQYPDGNKTLALENQTASFTQDPSTFGTCTGGTQSSQTLAYITGWLTTASWYCGINGFKQSEDDTQYI